MYWRVAGSDRCAVNYSALNEIEKSANVRPFYSPCIPHGLNNAGKKMKAPSVEFVRKYLNAITRGKVGKSRTLFYNLFKQRPARSGQVRWFCDFMHIHQIHEIGIVNILQKFISECVKRDYSKKTAQALKTKLQDPSFLADVIIEAAGVADGSLELCRLTYVLEGDSPLIFVAFAALNGFEKKFRSIDSIDMPKLAAAAAEAADIIKETLDPYRCAMANASLKLECAKVSVEDFHQKIADDEISRHRSEGATRSSSRKQNRRDWRPSNAQGGSCISVYHTRRDYRMHKVFMYLM